MWSKIVGWIYVSSCLSIGCIMLLIVQTSIRGGLEDWEDMKVWINAIHLATNQLSHPHSDLLDPQARADHDAKRLTELENKELAGAHGGNVYSNNFNFDEMNSEQLQAIADAAIDAQLVRGEGKKRKH